MLIYYKVILLLLLVFTPSSLSLFRYQLEVPDYVLKKNQPVDYEAKSSKKGWRRFHTETIRAMLEELIAAEDKLQELQRDEMRKLFEKFDHSRDVWAAAVRRRGSVPYNDCPRL